MLSGACNRSRSSCSAGKLIAHLRDQHFLPIVPRHLVCAVPQGLVQKRRRKLERGKAPRIAREHLVDDLPAGFRRVRRRAAQLLLGGEREVPLDRLRQNARQLPVRVVHMRALGVGDAEAAAHRERLAVDVERLGRDDAPCRRARQPERSVALACARRIRRRARAQARIRLVRRRAHVGRAVLRLVRRVLRALRQPVVAHHDVPGRRALEHARKRAGVEPVLLGILRRNRDAEPRAQHMPNPSRLLRAARRIARAALPRRAARSPHLPAYRRAAREALPSCGASHSSPPAAAPMRSRRAISPRFPRNHSFALTRNE